MEEQGQTSCESCRNYIYDEEYGHYVCEMDLDKDEMAGSLDNQSFQCPYYQLDDEYRIVREQI